MIFFVYIPLQIVLFKYMLSKRFCLKCLHTFLGRDSSFQSFGWECFLRDSWVENLFRFFLVVISLQICLENTFSSDFFARNQIQANSASDKFRFRHIYERNTFTSESV